MMNKTLDNVIGVVEAVNPKFNHSFLLNGKWFNLSKGVFDPGVKKGDNVVLTLKEWQSNGKSGVNVVEVKLQTPSVVEALKTENVSEEMPVKRIDVNMSKDEWAAKDRRISRQGVIQVAVQVTANFDKAVELANKMLEFVNA